MAYEEHLADLIRDRLRDEAGVDEKKMFGGLCWMLNGNMVCGVNGDRFLFRVGKERFDEALAWPGASPMEMGGRRSAGFLWVEFGRSDQLRPRPHA